MPGSARALSVAAARAHIERSCLQPADAGLVGIETEWHVWRAGEPYAVVPIDELRAALDARGRLPAGSAITFEPGGQIELSSAPTTGVAAACAAAETDIACIRGVLAAHDIVLSASGVDPRRTPSRQLHAPRYEAMERYFDGDGPHGRMMMTRTAAVQVNVDNGNADTMAARWRLLHLVGPTLVAMFANSPIAGGRETGWRSTRVANWWAMDATRTHPVSSERGLTSWCDYALDARVMFIRARAERFTPIHTPLTMRDWITGGHACGYPTIDDLDYHLTTLFPPVRPRGWFEVRYLDALDDPWWQVAAAVVATLVDNTHAGATASAAVERTGTERAWLQAARSGLEDPALADCAASVMAAVVAALSATCTTDGERLAARCAEYRERFVARRRTPADEALDRWRASRPDDRQLATDRFTWQEVRV